MNGSVKVGGRWVRWTCLLWAAMLWLPHGVAGSWLSEASIRPVEEERSLDDASREPWHTEFWSRQVVEALRKSGLVHGNWYERREVYQGLRYFARQEDELLEDWFRRSAPPHDPVLVAIRASVVAVSRTQRRQEGEARRVLEQALETASTNAERRAVGGVLTVLLWDRLPWSETREWCEKTCAEAARLVGCDELAYRCTEAAEHDGEWEAATRMAMSISEKSEYWAFARYSAGRAAGLEGRVDMAKKLLGRLSTYEGDFLKARALDVEARRLAPEWEEGPRALERRAQAVLVAVLSRAGQKREALDALSGLPADSRDYEEAAVDLLESPDLELVDLPGLLRGPQGQSFELRKGLALRQVGDFVGAAEALRAAVAREEADLFSQRLESSPRIQELILEIETRWLQAERTWRAALVNRSQRWMGSFFVQAWSKTDAGHRDSGIPMPALQKEPRGLLRQYLAAGPTRLAVRNCVRTYGKAEACSELARRGEESISQTLDLQERERMYDLERLLAMTLPLELEKQLSQK